MSEEQNDQQQPDAAPAAPAAPPAGQPSKPAVWTQEGWQDQPGGDRDGLAAAGDVQQQLAELRGRIEELEKKRSK